MGEDTASAAAAGPGRSRLALCLATTSCLATRPLAAEASNAYPLLPVPAALRAPLQVRAHVVPSTSHVNGLSKTILVL